MFYHGEPDISLLERRCVVGPIARDGDDFLLVRRPGYPTRHDALDQVVLVFR